MRWESSGVVGFDLGPLIQGQMRTVKLKSASNSLIIGPRMFWCIVFTVDTICIGSPMR